MKNRCTRPRVSDDSVVERFAALIQVAYDGVLLYDAGMVLNATPGAAALFGRVPDDVYHRPVLELVTEESGQTVIQRLAARSSCPALALREDGTHIPIEMSVQANVTLNGRPVQVVALRDASRDELFPYVTDRGIARR